MAMRDRRALEARRDLAARVLFTDGSVVAGLADAVEESKVRAPRSAGSDSVVTDDSRAVRAAIGRLYDPELQASGKDFYDVLEKVGVRPLYGRYLREGPRRGDGAYAASNTIRALEFFRNTLPRHQRELKLRRQFSARSSDAVEAVDFCVEIEFRTPHAIDATSSLYRRDVVPVSTRRCPRKCGSSMAWS